MAATTTNGPMNRGFVDSTVDENTTLHYNGINTNYDYTVTAADSNFSGNTSVTLQVVDASVDSTEWHVPINPGPGTITATNAVVVDPGRVVYKKTVKNVPAHMVKKVATELALEGAFYCLAASLGDAEMADTFSMVFQLMKLSLLLGQFMLMGLGGKTFLQAMGAFALETALEAS